MRSGLVTGCISLIIGLLVGGTAAAQRNDGAGPHISGVVGGSLFNGRVRPAEALTAGYRFNRVFGFDIAVERAGLRFSEQPDTLLALFPPTSRNDGRALLFLSNAVATIPVDLLGFRPYVSAGGGIANLRQAVRFAVPSEVHGIPIDRSQNVLALTAGGGVEYPVRRDLAVGLDVRYLRLFSERFEMLLPDRYAIPEPVDAVRFGTRIAYRF